MPGRKIMFEKQSIGFSELGHKIELFSHRLAGIIFRFPFYPGCSTGACVIKLITAVISRLYDPEISFCVCVCVYVCV